MGISVPGKKMGNGKDRWVWTVLPEATAMAMREKFLLGLPLWPKRGLAISFGAMAQSHSWLPVPVGGLENLGEGDCSVVRLILEPAETVKGDEGLETEQEPPEHEGRLPTVSLSVIEYLLLWLRATEEQLKLQPSICVSGRFC